MSQPAEYVDSSAYLPLKPDVSRQVLDFAEIHGATPEQVHKWANDLGPGWVPHMLGDHPSANPAMVHDVAVKLTDAPKAACTLKHIVPGEPLEERGGELTKNGYYEMQKNGA